MAERVVPTDGKRPDWPRLVAEKLNGLGLRTAALETVTDWSLLGNYADDVAAAAGGVAVGELYRTASAVKVRVA